MAESPAARAEPGGPEEPGAPAGPAQDGGPWPPGARSGSDDPPLVPVVLAGIGGWLVAGLVVLITGAPGGRTCLAGLAGGGVLLAVMWLRDRRRDRSAG